MSRYSLTVRDAVRSDAPVLAQLWSDAVRRADATEQLLDVEMVIKAAVASPEERIVVVEHEGQLAGAVYLRITTLTPLNLEPCVQSIHPRVFERFRGRGIGHALMEAAATFAEDNGILHVATGVPHSSRESNRFMARLGLAPVVMYRVAPAAVLRSRITPKRQARGAESGRSKVLAARLARRARAERQAAADS